MAAEISRIAVLAPFATGIGRRPGLSARVQEELAPALEVFGQECVLEVPRALVAEGRVAIPLVPPQGLTPAAWFPQLCERHQLNGSQPTAEHQLAAMPAPRTGPGGAATALETLLDTVALPQEPSTSVRGSGNHQQSPKTLLRNHILRHPDYQARCSAWQGLSWLHTMGNGSIQWLLVDIDPASCPDELHHIEDILLEEEPHLLLIDLPLTNTPRDQATLALLAQIGDQLLAPVLSWLDSRFWGIENWLGLDLLPYLPTLLDQPQYGKWRSLGHRDEARLLSTAIGRFAFLPEEQPASLPSPETPEPLWLAPIWALGALILSRQLKTGLPYPLAGAAVSPPMANAFALEAVFSEDRCLQFLQAHQAPIIGHSTGISFAGLPLTDGSNLELQLLIRSVLGWLFSLEPTDADATELEAELLSQWQRAGITPPAEIDFTLDQGQLFVAIHPPGEMSAARGEITLQLPWSSSPSPKPGTGA